MFLVAPAPDGILAPKLVPALIGLMAPALFQIKKHARIFSSEPPPVTAFCHPDILSPDSLSPSEIVLDSYS